MKQQYRLFRRADIYYVHNNLTGKQESLRTKDRVEAHRLFHAKNEAYRQPQVNLQIARAYLAAGDPELLKRTWRNVMEAAAKTKQGPTLLRWTNAMAEEPFDLIRDVPVLETRAEHLLEVLSKGTVSTNVFLRRLHNFALDMSWLPWPIMPRKRWPKIEFKDKRAITFSEHQRILASEENPDWRDYYELLWHLGGSQSDIATLTAEDIDWNSRTVAYARMKTASPTMFHFGDAVATILRRRPSNGFLFPHIAHWTESWRGKAFTRRRDLAKVSGVSLHSYRYAWAERAKECGYPERFAQEALGHSSKAVHRAYAKMAQVKVPALEEWEKKIVRLPEIKVA
jgi:integrase